MFLTIKYTDKATLRNNCCLPEGKLLTNLPHFYHIFTLNTLYYNNNYCLISGRSDSKESACNEGDPGLIPGLGRSPGEVNGNLLQHSCLENTTGKGAWWATCMRSQRVRHNWAPNTHTHTTHTHTHTHTQSLIKYILFALFCNVCVLCT